MKKYSFAVVMLGIFLTVNLSLAENNIKVSSGTTTEKQSKKPKKKVKEQIKENALLSSTQTVTVNNNERNKANKNEVIVLYASVSCPCTLEHCKSMREEVQNNIDRLSKKKRNEISLIEIDYEKDMNSVNELMKKYDFYYLPCLIILDKNKELKYKASFEMDSSLCSKAIKGLVE